jgi:ABC-type multidrug transport system fused ATPase/permease subunit
MLTTIKKLLFLLTPQERKNSFWLVVMIIIMAILDVVGVASIMPFIATIANPEVIKTNKFLASLYSTLEFTDTRRFLYFLGILCIISLVLSLTFKAFTTYVQLRFNLMREYSIGRRLIEAYLGQPYPWFLNKHSANLGNTILTEVNQVVGSAMGPMMNMIAQSLVSMTMLGLLIAMDPKLALTVGLALAITYGAFYYIMRGFLFRTGTERLAASNARHKMVNEAFSGIKEVKVSGLEKTYVRLFSQPAEKYAKTHASVQVLMQVPRFAVEAVSFGGLLLVVLYLMSGPGGFASGLPLVAVYSFAGYRLMPALQSVYASSVQLRSANAALDLLYKDMCSLPSLINGNETVHHIPLNEAITLKGINFSYPFAKTQALHNIFFSIPARTTIGLIGTSGSGKTTTIDIILGLLQADSGLIEVDGVEINSLNIRSWQKTIGYVPQQIFLTDDTIASNIAFGEDSDNIKIESVERAARIANLHEFVIKELTEGYATTIGERGIRLSGGQRQRIGIARALYHNPQLLILDEATSALDNITEQAVMEAVNNLGGNITIIIIAHRLSTVRNCNQIYMMQQGRIIANGTYDELMLNKSFKMMSTN